MLPPPQATIKPQGYVAQPWPNTGLCNAGRLILPRAIVHGSQAMAMSGTFFTHRGLADCHAVITLPSGDALAEELHVSTATLDGAASTAAISTSRSISITINHSVVAAATDTQPLKSRKFPDGGWAVFLALLELELGWNVAEVKMPQ